ncbi:hypothetical protein FORC22_1810 [Vibrio parahaemolyticus]|nr:hypothetical protein FORC22_1810 [Vibrio parahaemolyticus]
MGNTFDMGRGRLTKHLRVILNAWHFSFHVEFSVYGGKVEFRGRVVHTLMRR